MTDADLHQSFFRYGEICNYRGNPGPLNFFLKGPNESVIGHFTQLLWKESKYLGCAVVHGTNGNRKGYFTVAQYSKPGNMLGSVLKNVGNPDDSISTLYLF